MDQRRLEAGGVASRASFGSEVGAVHHPTHCTTLAEFHHFWLLFFRRMSQNKRQQGWNVPELASYLCKTYFFHLSPEDAREQYQLKDPKLTEDGRVICASWWASYVRLQPGSASGTQPVESMHANGIRAALVASLQVQEESQKPPELMPFRPLCRPTADNYSNKARIRLSTSPKLKTLCCAVGSFWHVRGDPLQQNYGG